MKILSLIVRSELARRLNCSVAAIHPWQRLDRDLDLGPLDLVLIALRIEETQGVALTFEDLENVETVGELVDYLAEAISRERWHESMGEVA